MPASRACPAYLCRSSGLLTSSSLRLVFPINACLMRFNDARASCVPVDDAELLDAIATPWSASSSTTVRRHSSAFCKAAWGALMVAAPPPICSSDLCYSPLEGRAQADWSFRRTSTLRSSATTARTTATVFSWVSGSSSLAPSRIAQETTLDPSAISQAATLALTILCLKLASLRELRLQGLKAHHSGGKASIW